MNQQTHVCGADSSKLKKTVRIRGAITIITYENIKVVSPYNIKKLEGLTITREINQHNRIYFTGIIPDDKKDAILLNSNINDKIEVVIDNATVIFKGIVTDISIRVVNGIYHIAVFGISSTFDLDLKPKKRSFQNAEMTYNSLIKQVISEYDSSDFISMVSGNLEKIIVQYNETDWEFLKRMASHFNTGLVVEAKSQTPKFIFGVPEGKEVTTQHNYNIGKTFNKKNFAYYVIKTDDLFEIGDKIRFKSLELIVYNIENTIRMGRLENKYTLLTSEGLKQLFVTNEKISGNSLEGKIIDIEEDKVRVHLDIDKEQKKEEAFWFLYSTYYTTEGQTGGYCTPELDDRVNVYFPDNEEEKALVVKSVRRKTSSGDKISDPDIKYFRTKYGKEKKFTKKDLSISATDDKLILKLNEDNGIEILSNESIKITSSEDLIVKAENIEIEAKKEMFLNCEDSSITMDATTHFYGKYVKVRC